MNKFISSNTYSKTKPIITTLFSFFFIFLPYSLIWLIYGQGREIFFNSNNINININTYWYNPSNNTYAWEFYLIYFSFLLIPILIFLFGKFIFNILEIDSIPFFYLTCWMWIGILLTGIMPNNNKDELISNLIIISKFIFVIIFSLIFFIVFNFIVNIIILRNRNSINFYDDFKHENDFNDSIIKSQKKVLDKRKKEKETSWIV